MYLDARRAAVRRRARERRRDGAGDDVVPRRRRDGQLLRPLRAGRQSRATQRRPSRRRTCCRRHDGDEGLHRGGQQPLQHLGGPRGPAAGQHGRVDDDHVDQRRAGHRRAGDVVAGADGGDLARGAQLAGRDARPARSGRWPKARSRAGRPTRRPTSWSRTRRHDGATVNVTLLFEDGTAPLARTFPVSANSRFNVHVRDGVPGRRSARRFGAIVESRRRDAGADRRRTRDVFECLRRHLGRRHQRAGDAHPIKDAFGRVFAGYSLRPAPTYSGFVRLHVLPSFSPVVDAV